MRGVDDLDVPWGGRGAGVGLAAVPWWCGAVIIGMVDVGPATGPRWLRGAHGPLVVCVMAGVGGEIVVWLVVECAIAEVGGEDERVGEVGLLEGVVDPVGDAGLLGAVALVCGGGVVVLCHGAAGGDGGASGFALYDRWRLLIISVTSHSQFRPNTRISPSFYNHPPQRTPLCSPPLGVDRTTSCPPLSPHEQLPHTHEAARNSPIPTDWVPWGAPLI